MGINYPFMILLKFSVMKRLRPNSGQENLSGAITGRVRGSFQTYTNQIGGIVGTKQVASEIGSFIL